MLDFVLPRGAQGPAGADGQDGAQGPQGPAGPNEVSTTTTTNITGLLKGNGTTVQQAVAGTDYAKPSNTVYATLLASGWTFDKINDTGAATRVVPEPGPSTAINVYQQTVSVAGITENSTAIVSLSQFVTSSQFKAATPLQLIAVEQGDGTITMRIGASYSTSDSPSPIDPPTVDIPIQVTIL